MKVGFIGLGAMGRGMAANLQMAGFELVVHDIARTAATPFVEKGAAWADAPRALAEACDVVLTSLPTPADVKAVASGDSGLLAGLRNGATWFDLSTNAVDVVRSLHATCASSGVAFLDAPVSGGPAGAASGRMAIWVGGDRPTFEARKAILDAMADQVRHIGDIGAGTIAKLVHNSASVILSAGLIEVFSMGVKAGVEPLALWEAIRQGALGRQRTFELLGTRFLHGKFDPPSFALRLLNKDMQLALQLGREVNVPMRLAELAGAELTEAMSRGMGGLDSQAFLDLQRERAGIAPIAIPIESIRAAQEKG